MALWNFETLHVIVLIRKRHYKSLALLELVPIVLQNVELQNAEFQNVELQNAELQNVELQNVESCKKSKHKTSNLTERQNTKRWILQNLTLTLA